MVTKYYMDYWGRENSTLTGIRKEAVRILKTQDRTTVTIREAMQKTTYIYCPNNGNREIKLTKAEAIKKLGEIGYLSGIGRSAFHWTAFRETLDGKGNVYFDSRRLFK